MEGWEGEFIAKVPWIRRLKTRKAIPQNAGLFLLRLALLLY